MTGGTHTTTEQIVADFNQSPDDVAKMTWVLNDDYLDLQQLAENQTQQIRELTLERDTLRAEAYRWWRAYMKTFSELTRVNERADELDRRMRRSRLEGAGE